MRARSGSDTLFFELVDGAQVHLSRVDQVALVMAHGRASPPSRTHLAIARLMLQVSHALRCGTDDGRAVEPDVHAGPARLLALR